MSRCYWFICSLILIPLQSAEALGDHRDRVSSTSQTSAVQIRRQPRIIINREEQERQTGVVEGVGEEFLGEEPKAGMIVPANVIQAPRLTLFNAYSRRLVSRLH